MVSNGTSSAEERKKLEDEKGIVIRFVIGHRSDSIYLLIFNVIFWRLPIYYFSMAVKLSYICF